MRNLTIVGRMSIVKTLGLRGYDTLANVRKKRIKKAILGKGVSLTSCFSTDETLGTGYDIHLLRAMIADHVTLPAISLQKNLP